MRISTVVCYNTWILYVDCQLSWAENVKKNALKIVGFTSEKVESEHIGCRTVKGRETVWEKRSEIHVLPGRILMKVLTFHCTAVNMCTLIISLTSKYWNLEAWSYPELSFYYCSVSPVGLLILVVVGSCVVLVSLFIWLFVDWRLIKSILILLLGYLLFLWLLIGGSENFLNKLVSWGSSRLVSNSVNRIAKSKFILDYKIEHSCLFFSS